MIAAGRLRAINTRAPFDYIQIEFQDALFAENQFGDGNEGKLSAFAKQGAAGSEEDVFHQLLRNGGPAAKTATFEIILSSDLDGVPIESVMLVEARIFSGNDGMLQFR